MQDVNIAGEPPIPDKDHSSSDMVNASVASSTSEVVQRFGSANAEFIKSYTGIDNETGQTLAKGLKDLAKSKVNPEFASQNLKQQAGYAAEVAATGRDNAEAIINRSDTRTIRSDDLAEFGKNHNVVDRVKAVNGQIIEGSQSQMKFVGDRDRLLNDIAKPDGKFARYRGVKLDLPSEQFEGAKQRCKEQADLYRQQANAAVKAGKLAEAKRLNEYADNYDELANNVQDSGLTTNDALEYRLDPTKATTKDILRTSHRAGIEGAKCGAVIGGAISLLTNTYSWLQGKKDIDEACVGLATDTAKAGALGYTSAAAGSALKGLMQQSTSQYTRSLATTSAPALAVAVCLSLGSSVKRLIAGEISEAEFLAEVGEKGSGMLTAGMMSVVGQIAIPIPFVGAAIGGMIGYTLSSMFYQTALDAARGAELSCQELARITAIETEARKLITEERAKLEHFIATEIPQLEAETAQLFTNLAEHPTNIDNFATAINSYALLLGETLQFNNFEEFQILMDCDDNFVF